APALDQAGLLQRGEVLRDRRLRDGEAGGEVLHRRLAPRERLEDRPPAGVRQRLEDPVLDRRRALHDVTYKPTLILLSSHRAGLHVGARLLVGARAGGGRLAPPLLPHVRSGARGALQRDRPAPLALPALDRRAIGPAAIDGARAHRRPPRPWSRARFR